jgi:hypothetical protein
MARVPCARAIALFVIGIIVQRRGRCALKTRLFATGFGLLLLALPAFGWGQEGHKIVCEIAFMNLSDQARSEVLKLRDQNYKTFSDSCLWPDDVRDEKPSTKPYHYINIPGDKQRDEISIDAFCSLEHCVPWAIKNYAKIFADKTNGPEERREALLFVAHFVGDVHQPLHAGRPEDRGGNEIKVTLLDQFYKPKLHAVWDTNLIREAGMYWPEAASGLTETYRNQSTQWMDLDPDAWAVDSYLLSEEYAYRRKKNGAVIRTGQKLNQSYVRRALPVVEEQLAKAGFRLAHLLNQAVQGSLPAGW